MKNFQYECECKDKKLTQAVEIRGNDIHVT